MAFGAGVNETVQKLGQWLDKRRIMDRFSTESKGFSSTKLTEQLWDPPSPVFNY
jgi:hypothetical protein